jgi:hypothetical protein
VRRLASACSSTASTLGGLRDRALIGAVPCGWRIISPTAKRWWVRLHEKGGKRHEMPANHKLEAYLDEYLRAVGFGDEPKSPSSAEYCFMQ